MTNTQTQIVSFEVGNIHEMKFIGDSDLRPQFICTKRTAKTVTFEPLNSDEKITRRIKTYENVEYILEGNYSMSPRIKADKIIG